MFRTTTTTVRGDCVIPRTSLPALSGSNLHIPSDRLRGRDRFSVFTPALQVQLNFLAHPRFDLRVGRPRRDATWQSGEYAESPVAVGLSTMRVRLRLLLRDNGEDLVAGAYA
jgi:hypothetical protein